ncbi:MAG: hypothetical protein U0P81_02695 [Holophagaceae bacterium]
MAEAPAGPDGSLEALRRAHRRAYGLGLLACLGGPLALQLLLGRAIPAGNADPAAVQEIGYTFTGLTFLAAAWAFGRRGRVLARISALEPVQRPRALRLEPLRVAALAAPCALWGVLYWGLAGGDRNAYARTFLALTTLFYLGFAPRWPAWRRAFGARAPAEG